MLLYMLLYVFLKRLRRVIGRFTKRSVKRREKDFQTIPLIVVDKHTKTTFSQEFVITTWVSIIGTIVTLIVILIVGLLPGILTKLLDDRERFTPLSRIVEVELLNRGIETQNQCTMVKATATSKGPLQENTISMQIRKYSSSTHELAKCVPQDMIEITQAEDGRSVEITANLNQVIKSLYAKTPSGWFVLKIILTDQSGLEVDSRKYVFNRPYREDFRNLDEALEIHGGEFTSITDGDRGLRIRNRTKRGGYVSADFLELFDFKTNYTISGCYTVKDDDNSKPCGLDFVICNERGGIRKSVILCEGQRDGYAIKTGDEGIHNENVKVRAISAIVRRSSEKHIVKNYFKIRVIEATGGHLLQLFVSQKEGDFGEGTLAHNRFLVNSKFQGDHTKLRIRLWQAGCVELHGFEVAEDPPDLREGVDK